MPSKIEMLYIYGERKRVNYYYYNYFYITWNVCLYYLKPYQILQYFYESPIINFIFIFICNYLFPFSPIKCLIFIKLYN